MGSKAQIANRSDSGKPKKRFDFSTKANSGCFTWKESPFDIRTSNGWKGCRDKSCCIVSAVMSVFYSLWLAMEKKSTRGHAHAFLHLVARSGDHRRALLDSAQHLGPK